MHIEHVMLMLVRQGGLSGMYMLFFRLEVCWVAAG